MLSRETGAAEMLGEDAITVNPFDISATAAALDEALSHAARGARALVPSGCARPR